MRGTALEPCWDTDEQESCITAAVGTGCTDTVHQSLAVQEVLLWSHVGTQMSRSGAPELLWAQSEQACSRQSIA